VRPGHPPDHEPGGRQRFSEPLSNVITLNQSRSIETSQVMEELASVKAGLDPAMSTIYTEAMTFYDVYYVKLKAKQQGPAFSDLAANPHDQRHTNCFRGT